MGVRARAARWRPCGRGCSHRDTLPPAPSPEKMRQHLIVDADDTLWENNIYFERAFDEFTEFLAHSSLQSRQIRAILDEIELANSKIHGYGSKNFGHNLRQCYQRLCERTVDDGDLDTVMSF